jgi:hypothetical protein
MLRCGLMGFRLLRRTLLAFGLAAFACYSPTLPLPPPGRPEVSGVAATSDQYRLRGQVEPHAEVVERNRSSSLLYGELTGGDGRYDFIVIGTEGDEMELWYTVGKDSSPRVLFVLPPLENGAGGAPAQ